MKVSVETLGLADVKRDMQALTPQGRLASAKALTATAGDIKRAEQSEMRSVFDAPTQWTINALFIKPATPANMEALVWLKDDRAAEKRGIPAAVYLAPEIDGGRRNQKSHEKLLSMAGLLPKRWVAVPGEGARLDAYGNISRGQIIQILSQLRLTPTAGYTRNLRVGRDDESAKERKASIKRQKGQYFVVPVGGGLQPGVYQRPVGVTGSAFGRLSPKPILIFVKAARYKKRYKFFEVAATAYAQHYALHFDRYLNAAMRTAR